MSFEIIAGDFKKRKDHFFGSNTFFLYPIDGESGFFGDKTEKINIDQVEVLEIANEENVKNLGGAVGWGVAGAVLLGPVGLLAGALLGGKGKKVTFVCKFKDGRKFMATAKNKEFVKMQAAFF